MLLLFICLLKSSMDSLPCHCSISLLSFAIKLNTISRTHRLQFLSSHFFVKLTAVRLLPPPSGKHSCCKIQRSVLSHHALGDEQHFKGRSLSLPLYVLFTWLLGSALCGVSSHFTSYIFSISFADSSSFPQTINIIWGLVFDPFILCIGRSNSLAICTVLKRSKLLT